MGYARAGLLLLLCGVLGGCSHTEWQASFWQPVGPPPPSAINAFLKVHTRTGDVYVLDRWSVDPATRTVRGEGRRYDEMRTVRGEGHFDIPVDEVALLETNRPHAVTDAGPIVMGVVTGASMLMTGYCATNPKACFGSCPTFYAHDGRGPALQAEGFSASVARVFEATDVDSLTSAAPRSGSLSLLMRNEALETHMVRHVALLAVPRSDGDRVLRAGARYYPARRFVGPVRCRSEREDCRRAVADLDGVEYAPLTDPEDLGARQAIELEFPAIDGPQGLVISGRNSLVGTFLFYQLLAYLGTNAGEWLVALEGGDARVGAVHALGAELARIEVEIRGADGEWIGVGVYDEVGPIARDRQVLPLPETAGDGPIHLRLLTTRGFWKLDQLALAGLGEPVEPVRITPTRVLRDGRADRRAAALLRDPDGYLVTYPGDDYTFEFDLPAGDQELFVESRGYYYEWMREQWLEEQDAAEAARFMFDLPGALRRLAPVYKRMEADVDRIFWESRIGEAP